MERSGYYEEGKPTGDTQVQGVLEEVYWQEEKVLQSKLRRQGSEPEEKVRTDIRDSREYVPETSRTLWYL